MSTYWCPFLENNGRRSSLSLDRSVLPPHPSSTAAMVTKSIAPHTLRRIADTSRKFGRKTPTSPIPDIPTILRSLPEHKPLLPLLLSHGIPPKPATMCANRYDSYANELRVETETKLTPYLIHRRKNPPAVVYPLFLSHYTHALRDRAQYILNTALRCLKRESVDLADWVATYPAPLWLPVRLPLNRRLWWQVTVFAVTTRHPPRVYMQGSRGRWNVIVRHKD